MSVSLLEALVAHIDSVFRGPNGDYPSLLEALDGVTVEMALWKPSPTQNSIWQIVEHLIASKQWQIDMLNGRNPASPPWIEPAGDEDAWQAALVRLRQAHQRLKLAIASVPEADLLSVPASESSTLLELILSSGPAHEAHHGGQIDYLRGLQS